jgi:hypothetical protein
LVPWFRDDTRDGSLQSLRVLLEIGVRPFCCTFADEGGSLGMEPRDHHDALAPRILCASSVFVLLPTFYGVYHNNSKPIELHQNMSTFAVTLTPETSAFGALNLPVEVEFHPQLVRLAPRVIFLRPLRLCHTALTVKTTTSTNINLQAFCSSH